MGIASEVIDGIAEIVKLVGEYNAAKAAKDQAAMDAAWAKMKLVLAPESTEWDAKFAALKAKHDEELRAANTRTVPAAGDKGLVRAHDLPASQGGLLPEGDSNA